MMQAELDKIRESIDSLYDVVAEEVLSINSRAEVLEQRIRDIDRKLSTMVSVLETLVGDKFDDTSSSSVSPEASQ
jgi:SMC interacting uncharacterized protein involved in chromosome segregation